MFFYIEPEVSGELGENTVINTSVHPPEVSKLHYNFNGWLGDELLESFPCFIVADSLAEYVKSINLTGYLLGDVEITKSLEFEDLYPDKKLPKFFWFKVNGMAGVDDFGISDDLRLTVSELALNTLNEGVIIQADIEEILK